MNSDSPLDRQPDTALVARFVAVRDEDAFAELMRRHGPMVLRTCTRLLKHRQDAEDAFQAVFVVLAARSRAIRRVRSLGGWLHNVAVRVSCDVLRANRRRARRLLDAQREHRPVREDRVGELHEVLDEVLTALPAKYREAVILCDLEGHTREEAASRLNTSAGTVATWVARGRKRLRERLVRRGVTLGAGGLAAAMAQLAEAAPAVSPELAQATVRHAQLFLAGTAAGKLSAATKIGSLAQGVLHTMFLSKLSTTACMVALAAALVLGATPVSKMVGLTSQAQAAHPFLDDFEDGSAVDGSPVRWIAEFPPFHLGTREVVQGSFVVTPPSVATPFPGAPLNAAEADATVFGESYGDVSIRTRFRVTGAGDYWVILSARSTYDASGVGSSVYSGFNAGGGVFVGYTQNLASTDLIAIDTPLEGRATDMHMQFDVEGDQLKLWTWDDGSVQSGEPQVTATIPGGLSDNGRISLGVIQRVTGPEPISVAFREFAVVPEPSTVALASLGFVALAAFGVRTRVNRAGSAQ